MMEVAGQHEGQVVADRAESSSDPPLDPCMLWLRGVLAGESPQPPPSEGADLHGGKLPHPSLYHLPEVSMRPVASWCWSTKADSLP